MLWNIFPKGDQVRPLWNFSSVSMTSYRVFWNSISKRALGGTLLEKNPKFQSKSGPTLFFPKVYQVVPFWKCRTYALCGDGSESQPYLPLSDQYSLFGCSVWMLGAPTVCSCFATVARSNHIHKTNYAIYTVERPVFTFGVL
jgi:hypothetical protein